MDNFTVGNRCLVQNLESEAGQLLNGQHVTLADATFMNYDHTYYDHVSINPHSDIHHTSNHNN